MLLDEIPNISISVILNKTDKEFFLIFSYSTVLHLALNIEKMRKGKHPNARLNESYKAGKLEVQVLTSWDDSLLGDIKTPLLLASEFNEWRKQLREAGYKDLRGTYNPGKFSLKRLTLTTFNVNRREFNPNKAPLITYVIAKSTRNDKHVLGVFENVIEADEFCNKHFEGKIDNIPAIFAENELTKKYHNTIGLDLQHYYNFLRY